MSNTRDYGIEHIRARKGKRCYGMGIGVMLVDDDYPGFPGDVRNASGFPFPIQYKVVEDVSIKQLVYEKDKTSCLPMILQASKSLEKYGCRAISAECGYFAYFQREVAAHVDVPVFLSSLLQVPMAQQVIDPNKVVGIIGLAESQLITQELLEAVNISIGSNYIICCGQDLGVSCETFERLWLSDGDDIERYASFQKAEDEFINIVNQCLKKYPTIGAIVLTCTGWQPFARALQRQIDLPIFSSGTLLDYAYSVVVHRDYYGHV